MFQEIINSTPEVLLEEALEFVENKDYTNYAIHLTMACNLNNEEAIKYYMEDCESVRLFDRQDFDFTKNFYEATLDFPCSINNLGYMYKRGLAVTQNLQKATELFQSVSDKGFFLGTLNLASCYEEGSGIDKDIDKAIQLLKICIDKGCYSAMNNLGVLYKVEKKNPDMAIHYYEMALSNKCDNVALENLSNLYRNKPNVRPKEYVTNYFLSIAKEDFLKEIYNYGDFEIMTLKERFELQKELEKYKKENVEMKNHILASPDGPLYFEALQQWKNRF